MTPNKPVLYAFSPDDPSICYAEVYPESGGERIEIAEEYEGVPVTEVRFPHYSSRSEHRICLSKNVRLAVIDNIDLSCSPFIVEVPPDNPWLCSDGKAVYSKDLTVLYAFTARNDTSYTVPDGVKLIFFGAFASAGNLRELNLPDSLEELSCKALYACGLTDVRLPKGIKRLSMLSLGSIRCRSFVLPENIEYIEGVDDMGSSDAFSSSTSTLPVYLPDCFCKPEYDIPNFIFAPEYILDEHSKTLTMLDGVIYTKDMKALLAVTQKAPDIVTVPDGVEVIGVQASGQNTNIREVRLPKSVHTIMRGAFRQSAIEKINLENVKYIGCYAFQTCFNLSDTGTVGAEEIAIGGLSGCEALGCVRLPNIKRLGRNALAGLKDGAEIYLPEGLESIGEKALDSRFERVRIPRSVTEISRNSLPVSAHILELYEDRDIFGSAPSHYNIRCGCLVNVLYKTGEIHYAFKVFLIRRTPDIPDSSAVINGLFDTSVISGLFDGLDFFDLKSYDRYFRSVLQQPDEPLMRFEAAHYRLKYPVKLTEDCRRMYEAFIDQYSALAVRRMIEKTDVTADMIAGFPYLDRVKENELIELAGYSAELKQTEKTAFLMEYKNRRFADT